MKISRKLKELFSHHKAVNKYLNSLDNDFTPRTIYIFLACAICESENKSDHTYYKLPDVLDLCHRFDWMMNYSNQYPIYREHKKLLESDFVQRLTIKQTYKGQRFTISIYGKIQLRRLYNYLCRELYTSL